MEKELKRGPWHPAHRKPAHVGYYETRLLGFSGSVMAYWDGEAWSWDDKSIVSCVFQNRRWRGLARKPE